MGFSVTVQSDERQKVLEPEKYSVVICNALFLYNDIKNFSNLKFIQLTSAGYDRVPLTYICRNAIELSNAKGVYSIPMAEAVVQNILNLYRNQRDFERHQAACEWVKERSLRELNGKKALVVGCGDVGLEIAKRLCAFNVFITGVGRSGVDSPYVHEFVAIERLGACVTDADIVISTLPLAENTYHLFNRNFFNRMKRSSIFVNVSRGKVADEKALIDALERNIISGAVLDVFEEEPLARDCPLWRMENVILTPHNSFVGERNQERLNNIILENLKMFLLKSKGDKL